MSLGVSPDAAPEELVASLGGQRGERSGVGGGPGRQSPERMLFPPGRPDQAIPSLGPQGLAQGDAAAAVLEPQNIGQVRQLLQQPGPVVSLRPRVDQHADAYRPGNLGEIPPLVLQGLRPPGRRKDQNGVGAGLFRVAGHPQGEPVAPSHARHHRKPALGARRRRSHHLPMLLEAEREQLAQSGRHHQDQRLDSGAWRKKAVFCRIPSGLISRLA